MIFVFWYFVIGIFAGAFIIAIENNRRVFYQPTLVTLAICTILWPLALIGLFIK